MPKQTTHKTTILLLFLTLSLLFTSCTSPAAETPPVEEEKSTLQITYLDVGQGDCTFIQLPNGETMLIDAGNHKDGQSIIQYIQSQDTEVLDYVIATHPHADHIGGMAEVIRAFDVKNVYMPKKSHSSATFENLLDTIAEKALTIQTAKTRKVLFDELPDGQAVGIPRAVFPDAAEGGIYSIEKDCGERDARSSRIDDKMNRLFED